MDKSNRKRNAPSEPSSGETGLTKGSGIYRDIKDHIDESFERDLQADRGVKVLKTSTEKKAEKRLIVILENANLELGKLKFF